MIVPTATALSLLSSLSPTLSSVEDPVRASLQATADHFSNLVSWSTVAVAVGVALEGVEIAHAVVAWRKRKRREKREAIELQELAAIFPSAEARRKTKLHSDDPESVKLLLRLGIILVVIGVVGEWRWGAKLEDVHNAIHEYDVAKLTAAEKAAGDAATSARIAHEEADAVKGIADEARADAKDALVKARAAQGELAHAEADAAKAQAAASRAKESADAASLASNDALGKAKVAKDAAGKAEERVGVVAEQADDLLKKYAVAENERRKMEKSLAPRMLPIIIDAKGRINTAPLEEFAGINVIIEYVSDAEARRAVEEIRNIIHQAHWQEASTTANPDLFPAFFDGVVVTSYTAFPTGKGLPSREEFIEDARCRKAAETLVAFLLSNGWQAHTFPGEIPALARLPQNTIKIRVGMKPNNFRAGQ